VRPDFRNQGPGRSSRGVRVPFRTDPWRSCPCSGFAAAAHAAPSSCEPGIASPEVLVPLSTTTSVAPFSPCPGLSAATRWVRVARPPPVPSSGFLPLSTVLAVLAARADPSRSSPFAVAHRRFAALFHAARALGIALQSLPFSRSRTRSRGPHASLRVRVRPPNGATVSMGFAAPFPGAPTFGRGSPRGLTRLGGRDDGSPEPLDIVRDTQARPGTSLLGSVGLTGLGGRHARFEALLPSRVRSHDERHPGQGTNVWSVLSWVSPPLELSPASRGLGMRANGRARAGPSHRPLSKARHLATRSCQIRAPAVGPRTHGPPTCSVDRTLHVTVRRRPCSRPPSRWRSHAGRQSRCEPRRQGASRFLVRARRRDVLPAPPLGGAPRLPRPSSALRHEGAHGLDLGDARSRSASGPVSREIGQLFWGLAPLRVLS